MPQLDIITLTPIILGIALLFFGRKAFWLFVGAVAFVAALTFIPKYMQLQQPTLFYAALGVGVVAASAGFFVEKIALRVAGFLAGGYVFISLWEKFVPSESLPWWLPFIIGGILGAVLLSFLFEWALIVLSSATGAFLIVQNLNLSSTVHVWALVVLSVVGIVVQAKMKRGKSSKD
jgi:hypothetical protein